jgi:hypothetical protein
VAVFIAFASSNHDLVLRKVDIHNHRPSGKHGIDCCVGRRVRSKIASIC